MIIKFTYSLRFSLSLLKLIISLNLFDIKKGLCVNTLRGHTNYIMDILQVKNYEFNEPHGQSNDKMSIVLSASKDRTIKMWHTKMEQSLNPMLISQPSVSLRFSSETSQRDINEISSRKNVFAKFLLEIFMFFLGRESH